MFKFLYKVAAFKFIINTILFIYIIVFRQKLFQYFLNINKTKSCQNNYQFPCYIYRISDTFFQSLIGNNFKYLEKKISNNKIYCNNKTGIQNLKLSGNNIIKKDSYTQNNNLEHEIDINKFCSNIKFNDTCSLCLSKSTDGLFLPCFHSGVCFSCGLKCIKSSNNCIICKSKVENILKIKKHKYNIYKISKIYKII